MSKRSSWGSWLGIHLHHAERQSHKEQGRAGKADSEVPYSKSQGQPRHNGSFFLFLFDDKVRALTVTAASALARLRPLVSASVRLCPVRLHASMPEDIPDRTRPYQGHVHPRQTRQTRSAQGETEPSQDHLISMPRRIPRRRLNRSKERNVPVVVSR